MIVPTSKHTALILYTEGKPICNRCQKFGVKCDGYAQPRKVLSGATCNRKALLPKPSIKLLLPTFEFANELERRYFAQFQEKTASEIAPYFDSETWRRLVTPRPRTSHFPSPSRNTRTMKFSDRRIFLSPSFGTRRTASDIHSFIVLTSSTGFADVPCTGDPSCNHRNWGFGQNIHDLTNRK